MPGGPSKAKGAFGPRRPGLSIFPATRPGRGRGPGNVMSDRVQIHDRSEIEAALASMAEAIQGRDQAAPVLIGIRRGGVPLAEKLAGLLAPKYGQKPALGVVDINLYRDDWTRARSFPKVGKTDIPLSLEDRRVILVDDVLYTGRTVRAALDVLTEFGRASRIELAALVDRGHRKCP